MKKLISLYRDNKFDFYFVIITVLGIVFIYLSTDPIYR